MTQAMIVERFGLRLDMDQLAQALGISKNTIYNQLSAGAFPVKTYLEGRNRWADYRDVADYLDACRLRAA